MARASGYRPVAEMVEEALRRMAPYHARLLSPRTWKRAVEEHDALMRALREHDAERAEALARSHVGQLLDGDTLDQLFGLTD